MCKFIKFGFVVLLVVVAVMVCCDVQSRALMLRMTAEGAVGGALLGLLSALDKWLMLHKRRTFPVCRIRCVWLAEVKRGLCGGCLFALAVGIIALLSRG